MCTPPILHFLIISSLYHLKLIINNFSGLTMQSIQSLLSKSHSIILSIESSPPVDITIIHRGHHLTYNPFHPWIALSKESHHQLQVGSKINIWLVYDQSTRGIRQLQKIWWIEKNYVIFLVSVDPSLFSTAFYLAFPISWITLSPSRQLYYYWNFQNLPDSIPSMMVDLDLILPMIIADPWDKII